MSVFAPDRRITGLAVSAAPDELASRRGDVSIAAAGILLLALETVLLFPVISGEGIGCGPEGSVRTSFSFSPARLRLPPAPAARRAWGAFFTTTVIGTIALIARRPR